MIDQANHWTCCPKCDAIVSIDALGCDRCGAQRTRTLTLKAQSWDRTFGRAMQRCIERFAQFTGRAPIDEFLWWHAMVLLAVVATGMLTLPLLGFTNSAYAIAAVFGVLCLPTCAVLKRRLNDRGMRGSFDLLIFVTALMAGPVAVAMDVFFLGQGVSSHMPLNITVDDMHQKCFFDMVKDIVCYYVIAIFFGILPASQYRNDHGDPEPLLPK